MFGHNAFLGTDNWQALAQLCAAGSAQPASERLLARALSTPSVGLEEMAVLLSPAASPFLEQMAQRALELTSKHFGKVIELYVPLYISNYCTSGCAYCGFASDREVPRARLKLDEVEKEAAALAREGFDEVLLLTGERADTEDFSYLLSAVQLCRGYFNRVTVESFPMETEEYRTLVDAGLFGITIYQETYDRAVYDRVHRWGPKKDYDYRLATAERALSAGTRGAGLGALLGLGRARQDLLALAAHLKHLYQRFWDAHLSISFPRLRPEAGGFRGACEVSDRELAQFIFAFRIAFPKIHLVLSTRESRAMRDNLAGVGISKMSVGSKTTVGGYHDAYGDACQFEIADTRSRQEFCRALAGRGLMGVYKNWDRALA